MQKLSAVVLVFFVLVSVATLGYSEKEEGSGKGHETRKLLSKRNALKGLRGGLANMLEESPVRRSTIFLKDGHRSFDQRSANSNQQSVTTL